MENSQKKKVEDNGIAWLTRPCYNVLVLTLVYFFLLHDSSYKGDFMHALIWIPLAIIVVANVWALFDFFKNFKKPVEKNTIESEEE